MLEEVSRGEVLLAAAQRCLKLMRGFVGAQQAIMEQRCGAGSSTAGAGAAGAAGGGSKPSKEAGAGAAAANAPLSFEMVCALLNNAVDCYQQSLEFSEHVQVRAQCVRRVKWRAACLLPTACLQCECSQMINAGSGLHLTASDAVAAPHLHHR